MQKEKKKKKKHVMKSWHKTYPFMGNMIDKGKYYQGPLWSSTSNQITLMC